MMKTWQRNLIDLIFFIISTDTRIHAVQVFHIFFKLIYKFIKSGKSTILNSLWYIWFNYFISKLRKYNIWSFFTCFSYKWQLYVFMQKNTKKIRVPKFLEYLIKLKIKIIKNGYISWSLSKQFSKLNDAQGLHLAWGLNRPIWTIWQTK